ncbi:unnamed protein product [Amoebophrya sp. A25]|nr:unnamed protein product [Amoebophrya sp. A25]|eukprot:GSA25T00018388001.1
MRQRFVLRVLVLVTSSIVLVVVLIAISTILMISWISIGIEVIRTGLLVTFLGMIINDVLVLFFTIRVIPSRLQRPLVPHYDSC